MKTSHLFWGAPDSMPLIAEISGADIKFGYNSVRDIEKEGRFPCLGGRPDFYRASPKSVCIEGLEWAIDYEGLMSDFPKYRSSRGVSPAKEIAQEIERWQSVVPFGPGEIGLLGYYSDEERAKL